MYREKKMDKQYPYAQPVKKQTLAEQVAAQLKDAILNGAWGPGDALPTEPQLAEAYDVSRAVVRDATRMLAARGLVEAQHGRGVFVTESQAEAFGEALLLALRRDEATVWDVEQFEQMVFPEVCALAAAASTPADRERVAALGQAYLAHYAAALTKTWTSANAETAVWDDEGRALFTDFITAVYAATHNKLWQLLARPLLTLRSLRRWAKSPGRETPEDFIALESRFFNTVIAAVNSGDAAAARTMVSSIMRLPVEAETAMRSTPIGSVPQIRADWPLP
jgi:DNA-binding FadR family transcriptional regulator